MNRQFFLTHSPIDFYFVKNSDNFIVTEVPLYEFSNDGEHIILKIRKKDLTTWELLNIISDHLGIKSKEIGYAGLKDKHAMTIQYISIHKQYEELLENFTHDKIKILEKCYHNNKIRMGHLKGNRFFIRLKKVNPTNGAKIAQVLDSIKKYGLPNYFGFQRFGNSGKNYEDGESIINGTLKIRDKKKRTFLINAYQSHLFNLWLSKRVELSKTIDAFNIKDLVANSGLDKELIEYLKKQSHPFKILKGDIAHHYPYGRIFNIENLDEEIGRFESKDIVPTGLLSGKKTRKAEDDAKKYEEPLDLITHTIDGARRFAWIFPEDIEYKYREEEAWFELSFTLPKGSYATVLLEEIAHREVVDSN
jgi:tRNA pseudouridine13 synthase